jgi:hypothetical protein
MCSPNTSKPNDYKRKILNPKVFLLQYLKIREHLPLEDDPESLLELPELLDLPAFSPF